MYVEEGEHLHGAVLLVGRACMWREAGICTALCYWLGVRVCGERRGVALGCLRGSVREEAEGGG